MSLKGSLSADAAALYNYIEQISPSSKFDIFGDGRRRVDHLFKSAISESVTRVHKTSPNLRSVKDYVKAANDTDVRIAAWTLLFDKSGKGWHKVTENRYLSKVSSAMMWRGGTAIALSVCIFVFGI